MMNFKKITAVAGAALLTGMSMGVAAAASFPAPFTNGGVSGVAVVYGANSPNAVDAVPAQNIADYLETQMGSGSSGPSGDSVKLEKSTNLFNLGERASDFYTSLDEDELTTILSTGVYQNDDNDEFDYDQKIELSTSLVLKHFQDDDYSEEPAIGIPVSNGQHILNYTLDFSPDDVTLGANMVKLETTTLTMLGKEYYVLDAGNTSGTNHQITLLDSANDAILSEGESVTINAGSKSYTVTASFIGTNEAVLEVNGEKTNSLAEQATYKLSTGDYVGIKDIRTQEFSGGTRQVEFSIGSGKLQIKNAQEVEMNNEKISTNFDHKVNGYITVNSDNELDKIVLEWKADDDAWVAPNSELVMPGFNAIKLSDTGFVTPSEETTKVEPDGDDSFKLTTMLTDGEASFNFLYTNGSNFIAIGKDNDDLLRTSHNASTAYDMDYDNWFVATWYNGDDHESYLLEVSDIDDSTATKNTTTIRSKASGSTKAVTLDIGETDQIGEISFKLDAANDDAGTAVISVSSASGSGTISLNKLITKDGMVIQLPTNTSATGVGFLNTTSGTTFAQTFVEEDKDGNMLAGSAFAATLGITSGETTVSSINEANMSGGQDFESNEDTDDFVGYQNSSLATKTVFKTGGDQDSLEVVYHGEESSGSIYVSEVGTAAQSAGVMVFKDSERSSWENKNVIVVGGSCINSAAAQLLGGTACEGAFTSNTGVGEGAFLIQSYADAFSSGKTALLVAGYSAEDTKAAATHLTTQPRDIDTSVGNKYVGTVSASGTTTVAKI